MDDKSRMEDYDDDENIESRRVLAPPPRPDWEESSELPPGGDMLGDMMFPHGLHTQVN